MSFQVAQAAPLHFNSEIDQFGRHTPHVFSGPARDFFFDVSDGKVPGHSAIQKFGHNAAVPTTGADVYAGLGTYGFYPLVAQTMEMASDDPLDNATGALAGAWTVIVFGLDFNWRPISEIVTLTGTAPVQLQNQYVRMYRGIVLQAGTNETNLGNLSVRIAPHAVGTTAVYIAAGDGRTQQAIYTTPANTRSHFVKGYVGMADPNKFAEVAQFKWKARPNDLPNGAWSTSGQMSLVSLGSGHWQYKYGCPVGPLAGKTDIRIECFSTTATMGVVGGFDMITVKDGY